MADVHRHISKFKHTCVNFVIFSGCAIGDQGIRTSINTFEEFVNPWLLYCVWFVNLNSTFEQSEHQASTLFIVQLNKELHISCFSCGEGQRNEELQQTLVCG